MSTFREIVESLLKKESDDIFSKAEYYVLVFEDGYKHKPQKVYEWPHDQKYLDNNNMTIKDWLDEQPYWNPGCIGYELLDKDMNSLGLIKKPELNFTEDTVKQGNSWVNKGKEGTHGKFKTKKAADDQRKAMYANGYKG